MYLNISTTYEHQIKFIWRFSTFVPTNMQK